MQGGKNSNFTPIDYAVYVFYTDMNYANRYDTCVVFFAVEIYCWSIIKCFNDIQYVLKFAAPLWKGFRRPWIITKSLPINNNNNNKHLFSIKLYSFLLTWQRIQTMFMCHIGETEYSWSYTKWFFKVYNFRIEKGKQIILRSIS